MFRFGGTLLRSVHYTPLWKCSCFRDQMEDLQIDSFTLTFCSAFGIVEVSLLQRLQPVALDLQLVATYVTISGLYLLFPGFHQ